MPGTVDVGVVGVGHLGRHHARIYAELPTARLVGVVDRDAERARAVATLHGCEVYPDAASLGARIQAASVAVPTEHHCEVATQLLEAEVDVLVEKPLARTVAEADAILAAAAARDRRVMVGHTERFNPAVQQLAAVVHQPRFFEIHRLAAFSARSTDIDVVLDLMIHDLDLVLHLDGSAPAAVDAVGIAALTDKVDIANARLRLASGCVANLTASRISAEPLRRVRVFQAQTYVSCDTGRRRVERFQLTGSAGAAPPQIRHEVLPVGDEEPLSNELSAFLRCVSDRSVPPVDGMQGRRVVELASRIIDVISQQPAPP